MSSQGKRGRRREAMDKLPPANRIPISLAELGMIGVKEYGVACWHPDSQAKLPAEAVVLHLTIEMSRGDLQLGLRLKTARAVDEMIAMLERHRNDVWPGG